MLFQDAIDKYNNECAFRSVVNASTGTLTLTAASIAIGSPCVLATATNSLPALPSTAASPFWPNSGTPANFVQRPATATSVVNNLFVGIVARVPGTKVYLGPEEVGLAQCYGPYVGAIVNAPLSAIGGAGAILVPDYDVTGALVPVVAPLTSTSTNNLSGAGMSGLAVAMAAIASSSATATSTGIVFLRCM
jgi:hypothetical protein